MQRLRCSFAPQVAACSASAVRPALNIVSASGEPARLGNAVHEAQSLYATKGVHADAVELAQKHRCDADELGYLLWAGRKGWDAIAPFFGDVHCEEEFSWVDEDAGIVLAGHPDVFAVAPFSRLVVADWKSGFLWSDCEPQLKAYSWLLCQIHGTESVTAFHVNIRRDEIERFEWSYDELAEWWAAMAKRIVNGSERYSPGYEACRYCPRFSECPAGRELTTQTLAMVSEGEIDAQIESPDMVIDAFQRAKFIVKICEQVIDAARLRASRDGAIVASDGRELVIERQKREKIDAKLAWPELLKSIGEVQVIEACTLGKTKAMDAVRAATPKGKTKKAAVEEVMGRLRDAGAVSEAFIEKLELRKATKLIEQTV